MTFLRMIIKTYEELAFFIQMFKHNNAELLILESRGGIGKSSLVDEMLHEMPLRRFELRSQPPQGRILSVEL